MRWLFAVFVLSLCALLWAAFSIARHIRRHREQDRQTTSPQGSGQDEKTDAPASPASKKS